MLDKLDVLLPPDVRLTKTFARQWYDPQNEKLLGKRVGGQLYGVSGDLQKHFNLPMKVYFDHKYQSKKVGPKVEFTEVGNLVFSDIYGAMEQVFDINPDKAELSRVDLTADLDGVSVSQFERSVWCLHKRTTRQRYNADDGEEITERVQRMAAQTVYWGNRPRQSRAYNKTSHRMQILLPRINRERRDRGLPPLEFEQAFHYDRRKIITRVERQMGNRESAEAWGIAYLGEIHKLESRDPFEKFRFLDDAKGGKSLARLRGAHRVLVLMLRERVERDGLSSVKAWLREQFNESQAYRKWWKENEYLILGEHPLLSREKLLSQYQKGIREQLAA